MSSLPSLVAFIAGFAWTASAAALESEPCPPQGDLHRYVESHIVGDKVEERLGTLSIYYRLLAPFDPEKPTMLIINGGPGGDHSIVHAYRSLAEEMNVLSFDHRGLGCTKITSRYGSGFDKDLYTMKGAADDIDAIRRDLLGDKGKWFVYGVSYGGMLAQKYAIRHPDNIEGLILDSTFHNSKAIDLARRQYVRLFIQDDPATFGMYQEILSRYPDAAGSLLRKIWGLTYNYRGRTEEIPELFRQILATRDPYAARELYESEIYRGPWWGMSEAIACAEIWDHAGPTAYDDYYFTPFVTHCPKYKTAGLVESMNWDEELKKFPMRTLILAGSYDPVTPAQVMRTMNELIPESFLFENVHSGHGLWFEKEECVKRLFEVFLEPDTDAELEAISTSSQCQSEPESATERYVPWKDIVGTEHAIF